MSKSAIWSVPDFHRPSALSKLGEQKGFQKWPGFRNRVAGFYHCPFKRLAVVAKTGVEDLPFGKESKL